MTWKRATRDLDWLKARVTVDAVTGCWEWSLARNSRGYGYYGDNTGAKHVTRKAHRLAFELTNGFLPTEVIHDCDNPPCCNPDHLRAGDHAVNMRDMVGKGRGGHAKISPAEAEEIRRELGGGARGVDVARAHGVSENIVGKIKRGKTWC